MKTIGGTFSPEGQPESNIFFLQFCILAGPTMPPLVHLRLLYRLVAAHVLSTTNKPSVLLQFYLAHLSFSDFRSKLNPEGRNGEEKMARKVNPCAEVCEEARELHLSVCVCVCVVLTT